MPTPSALVCVRCGARYPVDRYAEDCPACRAKGAPANLTLYDPAAPAEAVGHGASKSRNTPFAGMELPGRMVATFLRGAPTVLDGKLA